MILHLLNRYVKIERETTAKNAVGTPRKTFTFWKEKAMGVQLSGGRTSQDPQGVTFATDAVFTCRYDEGIGYDCRLDYEGQRYTITHIEPIGRKEGLRLKAIMFIDE